MDLKKSRRLIGQQTYCFRQRTDLWRRVMNVFNRNANTEYLSLGEDMLWRRIVGHMNMFIRDLQLIEGMVSAHHPVLTAYQDEKDELS